ncbi:MAG: hypothetical protein JWO55_278 [Candidatus Saccharibacteria bacterium]|jgi:hypothetical protein|nr:hypothetical protein [Candidatus Saccharibacteria bacterium]
MNYFVQLALSRPCYTKIMQPDNHPADWKQPVEQPSQAPYVVMPDETLADSPIVTLTPENPVTDAVPLTADMPDNSGHDLEQTAAEMQPVRWQAQEYIQHDKGQLWFVVFAAAFVALMAIAVFVIQSVTFNILVPVMAVALFVYVNRPPRMIDYTLSRKGLYINDRLYPFSEFKGFGVIHDGKEYSVLLLPVKRFKPGVSVYFPEVAGEAIVDMLGARLPMQELHLDVVDRIIRKLRI